MVKFDNLLNLRSIFQEITLIKKESEVVDENDLPAKISQLLDRLAYMQALNISIRVELTEKLLSLLPAKTARNKQKRADNVIAFDRRKSDPDRRNLHTFLARDRRCGIADRRRRTGSLSAKLGSR
jgi:hypothetical protein